MMDKFVLKLFIAGRTPRSQKAIENLQSICKEIDPSLKYDIVVVDVLERPQLAEDEKILATPTLIKQLPPLFRRVVGDLSEKEKVLIGLDLYPVTTEKKTKNGKTGQK